MATHVRIDYDEHRYVTRAGSPDDRWDRDDTAADISINGIEIVSEAGYRDLSVPFDVDINKSYILLWADYNTGDSFGHDRNYVEFIDLFETIERAQAARKALEEGTSYTRSYVREDGTGVSTSIPWAGYFESLNELRLDVVSVSRFR
ncbi:hypothetical protein [Xanthomonas phage X1]|nr:hypothetical protein [Xanthomonas phage X1]